MDTRRPLLRRIRLFALFLVFGTPGAPGVALLSGSGAVHALTEEECEQDPNCEVVVVQGVRRARFERISVVWQDFAPPSAPPLPSAPEDDEVQEDEVEEEEDDPCADANDLKTAAALLGAGAGAAAITESEANRKLAKLPEEEKTFLRRLMFRIATAARWAKIVLFGSGVGTLVTAVLWAEEAC